MKPRNYSWGILIVAWLCLFGCSGNEVDDPCPEQKAGKCGLSGRCVQCNHDYDCLPDFQNRSYEIRTSLCISDNDCPRGLICHMDSGFCIQGNHCSVFGECLPYCPPRGSAECPVGRVCVESKCLLACQITHDCIAGVGTCLPEGHCTFERCQHDGDCPEGFELVPGNLACRYETQ